LPQALDADMSKPTDLPSPTPSSSTIGRRLSVSAADVRILVLSIAIQIVVGILFGHIYDMRIFMAAGHQVAAGQNPYLPQDLSPVFDDPGFAGITTVGYPPPRCSCSAHLHLAFAASRKCSSTMRQAAADLANIALAYLPRPACGNSAPMPRLGGVDIHSLNPPLSTLRCMGSIRLHRRTARSRKPASACRGRTGGSAMLLAPRLRSSQRPCCWHCWPCFIIHSAGRSPLALLCNLLLSILVFAVCRSSSWADPPIPN
jgi:hypothetical protein